MSDEHREDGDVVSLDDARERMRPPGMGEYERGEAFMIEPRCAEHLTVGETGDMVVFTPFEGEPLRLVGLTADEAVAFGVALIQCAHIISAPRSKP